MWNSGTREERETIDGLTEEQKAGRADRVAWAQELLANHGYDAANGRTVRSGQPVLVNPPPPPYSGHDAV